MGERQTIVIAGAGIGGLTAALALSAAGYAVVLAERAPELSEAGAGIQLAPNAGGALAALGLGERIAARAIEPVAIDVLNGADGRTIASVAGRSFRERYGHPYQVIHRADLQSILLDAVQADPSIRLERGTTIAEQHVKDGGLLVRVRKATGTEVIPTAAVIGADGVWSATRGTIAARAEPAETGRTAWRAIVAADVAGDLAAADRVALWLGRDAHLVHYPVARGAAINIVAIVREDWDKRGWNAVGERADIARRFAGWSAMARALIAAPLSWHKYAIATVDPRGTWTAGRTALLGDAAHAMVPFLAQGAAMAIEDAAVLTERLYAADDVPAALREYEVLRKGRVVKVAAASNETGRRYHDRGVLAALRDAALRVAGERLILGRNDWIYRWRPGGTSDLPT